MLEAMGASLPIIATPRWGIPEVIENGKEGFIVELGDVEALQEKDSTISTRSTLTTENGY